MIIKTHYNKYYRNVFHYGAFDRILIKNWAFYIEKSTSYFLDLMYDTKNMTWPSNIMEKFCDTLNQNTIILEIDVVYQL